MHTRSHTPRPTAPVPATGLQSSSSSLPPTLSRPNNQLPHSPALPCTPPPPAISSFSSALITLLSPSSCTPPPRVSTTADAAAAPPICDPPADLASLLFQQEQRLLTLYNAQQIHLDANLAQQNHLI